PESPPPSLVSHPPTSHHLPPYVPRPLPLDESPHINRATLKRAGFTEDELHKLEESLPAMFELSFAFSPWSIGAQTLARLGIAESEWQWPVCSSTQNLGCTTVRAPSASITVGARGQWEGDPR